MNTQASIRPDVERVLRLEELRTFRSEAAGGHIYALVAHNRELGLICDFWAGECQDVVAFREVLEFIVGEVEGGTYRLWLADLRFLSSSFAHSNDWLVHDLMPRAFAVGLEREAVVLPEDRVLPAEYDVFHAGAHVIDELGNPRVRGFTDVTEAKRWLLE
jgi:hypothetical protein